MSETQRASGIRFERKTREALRTDGYEVMRAAGSKGAVDLMAVKPGQILFVACKLSGICPPAEWDRLYELASWVGAVPVLAVNGPRGRGVAYWELTGRKVRGRGMGAQPARPFLTDEVAVPGVRQEWVEVQ